MKQISRRFTYANVISTLALFLVLGGASALAATQLAKNSVGPKQLKKNAVSAAKIKKEAVSGAKIKAGAVGTGQLADGAVTSSKIGPGAVAAAQLEPGQRSEVIASSTSSAFSLIDTYNPETWTTVMSLNLPSGNWVVQANLGLAIGGSGEIHIGCRLNQGGKVLAQSGTEGENLGLAPSLGGIDLAAVAGAGEVTVTCGASADGVSAINRSLIATRAGTVTAG